MPRFQNLIPLLLATFSLACGDPPQITGRVIDPWGKPVGGATVQLEGVPEHALADENGTFSFERVAGKRKIAAGKDGFIRNTESWGLPDDPEAVVEPLTIRVFPEPAVPGFHLIGADGYSELESEDVDVVGTELGAVSGIAHAGKIKVKAGEQQRVIFTSSRTRAELAHLNLQLHKVEFVENTTVPGVLGDETVKVNRYVVTGDAIPFDLKELESDNDYLIVTRNQLEAGHYAFHTEEHMSHDSKDGLDKTPPEMRKAWPFQVAE
jgi:hypothetical protein